MPRVTLLRRFPALRPPGSAPIVPPEHREIYPRLADDLAVLDREVDPHFQRADAAALRHQNRYRRQQVTVLLGAVLISGLATLQAVLPDQRWLGVLVGLLGIVLAATSRFSGELGALGEFLAHRVRAERLRALHFRYLSRTGPYAGDGRVAALRRAVAAVLAGREP